MHKIETYQMCHPELLSEAALCEILKNSCIALPISKNLDKDELVEIFKRIAMPLPQRKYNISRKLGKKLNDLRTAEEKQGTEISSSSNSTADPLSKHKPLMLQNNVQIKDRTEPSMNETVQESKKIRLLDSSHHGDFPVNTTKRKHQICSLSQSTKRQKITWP